MRGWLGAAVAAGFATATGAAAQTGTPPATAAGPPPAGPIFEIPSSGPSVDLTQAPAATGAPTPLAPPPGRTLPAPADPAAGTPAIAEQPPPGPAPAANDPPGACRDGSYAAIIDGRPQTVPARLCRQPDGSWKVSPR